jgi:LPXTG-motif cell wall-anchored protein
VIRKIAALMVVALAAVILPFASANAVSYGPKLPTKIPPTFVVAQNGKVLVVKLFVTASDGTSPAGEITYTISRVATAARSTQVVARATTGSVHVNGKAVTVTGAIAHPGSYVATAHFTPANAAKYLPSRGATRAKVGAVGGKTTGNGGGGLPNTGGPDLGWLLAGLALSGVGAGAVVYSRRRTAAAA